MLLYTHTQPCLIRHVVCVHIYDGNGELAKLGPNDFRDDCIIWQMICLPTVAVADGDAVAAAAGAADAVDVDVLVGYLYCYLVNCQKAP